VTTKYSIFTFHVYNPLQLNTLRDEIYSRWVSIEDFLLSVLPHLAFPSEMGAFHSLPQLDPSVSSPFLHHPDAVIFAKVVVMHGSQAVN